MIRFTQGKNVNNNKNKTRYRRKKIKKKICIFRKKIQTFFVYVPLVY